MNQTIAGDTDYLRLSLPFYETSSHKLIESFADGGKVHQSSWNHLEKNYLVEEILLVTLYGPGKNTAIQWYNRDDNKGRVITEYRYKTQIYYLEEINSVRCKHFDKWARI
jgi:hypothetical protein